MTLEKRLEQLQLWSSDPNAYATLQPELEYFDHASGYIAYRRILRGNVVLGDPVAQPDALCDVFRDYLHAKSGSIFCYLSEEASKVLIKASGKPMYFVKIGMERCINLCNNFSFSSSISGALKKAAKAKLHVIERDLSQLNTEELTELRSLNKQFIQGASTGKEIGFISRSILLEKEKGVRFFSIQSHDKSTPIGFCVLDPWYKQSKLIGYQLHQFRLGKTSIWGVYFSVVVKLAEMLQAEGLSCLSLGGCLDFTATRNPELPSLKSYDFFKTASLRLVDRFHPLTNLTKMKMEFEGFNINRYMAAPYKIPLLPIIRFAKANNMPLFPKLRA